MAKTAICAPTDITNEVRVQEDALGHFDAEGYRGGTIFLPVLAIGYVQCTYVLVGLACLSAFGSPERDGFGFDLRGSWMPPDGVHPDGAPVVIALVASWAMWIIVSSQYSVAKAQHMLARSRQGAGLLAPPAERRRSFLV